MAGTFRISVDVADAIKNINKFTNNVEKSFSNIKKIAVGLAGVFVGAKMISFLKESANEAAQAETSFKALASSIELAGRLGEDAANNLSRFAEGLEQTTMFSQEQIETNIGLLASFTKLSEQGLKEATQAALDLSAATGKDLDTSFQLISKAANGQVESFKKIGIEIKKGSNDAETFSNTLRALSGIQGRAQKDTNSFAGVTNLLGKAFNNLQEEIGRIFTSNPALIKALKAITDGFINITKKIFENKETIAVWVNTGISIAIKSLILLAEVMRPIIALLNAFKRGATKEGFLAAFNRENAKDNVFDELKKSLDELLVSMGKAESKTQSVSGGLRQSVGDLTDANDEEIKKRAAEQKKSDEERSKTFGQIGQGIGSMSQGAAGAGAAVSQIGGIIADAILPGLGQIVGPLLSFLGQGPEQVKKNVEEFVKQIPVIIQAIAESLGPLIEALVRAAPTVIKALADNADEIISAIISGIPDIIFAIIQAVPQIIFQLVRLAPTIAFELIKSLIRGIPRFVADAAKALAKAFLDAINPAKSVKKESDKLFFSFFQQGGKVPGVGNQDSVPALLTPGELVIDRSDTRRLVDFLNDFEGRRNLTKVDSIPEQSQNVSVQLNIGEKELANVMLNLNRRGFRVA